MRLFVLEIIIFCYKKGLHAASSIYAYPRKKPILYRPYELVLLWFLKCRGGGNLFTYPCLRSPIPKQDRYLIRPEGKCEKKEGQFSREGWKADDRIAEVHIRQKTQVLRESKTYLSHTKSRKATGYGRECRAVRKRYRAGRSKCAAKRKARTPRRRKSIPETALYGSSHSSRKCRRSRTPRRRRNTPIRYKNAMLLRHR